MIYYRKNKGVKVGEVWFSMPDELDRDCKVFNYHCLPHPYVPGKDEYLVRYRETGTLVTDLTESEEELLLKCRKDTKRDIKKGKNRGVSVVRLTPADLSMESPELLCFYDAYNNLFRQKGIEKKSIRPYLKELIDEKILYLSIAELDGEYCAFHVDLVADKICRNVYSVSNFRNCNDSSDRRIIGEANRFLQYSDMLYYKEIGCKIQDWGGYSSDDSLRGINEFKAGFGGDYQKRYYGKVVISRPLLFAYKLLRKGM